jgi:hypothetical protein
MVQRLGSEACPSTNVIRSFGLASSSQVPAESSPIREK